MSDKHEFGAEVKDTKLLAAWTPGIYSGFYPPFINLTMERIKGNVLLTVRLPSVAGGPCGETSEVKFTQETWREFVKMVGDANKVYEAADYLDSLCL